MLYKYEEFENVLNYSFKDLTQNFWSSIDENIVLDLI